MRGAGGGLLAGALKRVPVQVEDNRPRHRRAVVDSDQILGHARASRSPCGYSTVEAAKRSTDYADFADDIFLIYIIYGYLNCAPAIFRVPLRHPDKMCAA